MARLGRAKPFPPKFRRPLLTAVVTAGLKLNSSLNGLGASGPFFHDPLAYRSSVVAFFMRHFRKHTSNR